MCSLAVRGCPFHDFLPGRMLRYAHVPIMAGRGRGRRIPNELYTKQHKVGKVLMRGWCMGTNITKMTQSRGFCVEIMAAVTVIVASAVGLQCV